MPRRRPWGRATSTACTIRCLHRVRDRDPWPDIARGTAGDRDQCGAHAAPSAGCCGAEGQMNATGLVVWKTTADPFARIKLETVSSKRRWRLRYHPYCIFKTVVSVA